MEVSRDPRIHFPSPQNEPLPGGCSRGWALGRASANINLAEVVGQAIVGAALGRLDRPINTNSAGS